MFVTNFELVVLKSLFKSNLPPRPTPLPTTRRPDLHLRWFTLTNLLLGAGITGFKYCVRRFLKSSVPGRSKGKPYGLYLLSPGQLFSSSIQVLQGIFAAYLPWYELTVPCHNKRLHCEMQKKLKRHSYCYRPHRASNGQAKHLFFFREDKSIALKTPSVLWPQGSRTAVGAGAML